MIDISKKHLNIVKEILSNHVPDCEVRVFGSRIEGNAKPYSDLDLVIIGKAKLDRKIMIGLKEAFQESALPFRVDILDWHRISDNFKKIIEKRYKILLPHRTKTTPKMD